jgi:hypothetical protein
VRTPIRRTGGRLSGAAAVGALVLVLVALTAGPAPASTRPRAAPETPRVALLEQPAWSELGADVPLRLALTGPLAGLELRAIVHSSMTSRTGFERTVDGERLGSTVATAAAAPESLPPSPAGGRIFTLRLQNPNAGRDPQRLRLPMPRGSRTGVFPVEIELRDPESGERASSFVTHVVGIAPSADGAPLTAGSLADLSMAWIWKIAADPATNAAGRVRRGFLDSIGPSGRLTRLATAAARSGGVPLTLVPGPETLEAWAQRARSDPVANSGILALRGAARDTAQRQVMSGPYVQIDMPALQTAGLGDESSQQLSHGELVLSQVLGTRVDPRTTEVSPLDAVALARLQVARVDRVLVRPDQLEPLDEPPQLTPAHPFELEAPGRRLSTFQTDDGLAGLLGGDGTPALRAQHFLAGLAIVAMELPNQTRGLAVEMPARWDPPPALIDAVLAGLDENPLLVPVTLDGLFDAVPLEQDDAERPVVRELAPVGDDAPTVNAARFQATQARVEAYTSTVPAGDPAVAGYESGLLVAMTSTWPGAEGRARSNARLAGIDASIQAFSGRIEIPPTGLTATFTSRDAELPLSFNNRTGETVRVRVRFASDKLEFTNGNEQVLTLPPRNKTFRFPVEARASGTFPLRMTVTTEDGRLALGTARYTVRSTVVSGVGIFLTIGAGVFLAIWWITHWRRSRRQPIRPATLAT